MASRSNKTPNPVTPDSSGLIRSEVFGPYKEDRYIEQKVSVTSGAASAVMSVQIPARSRILWAQIKNGSAIAFATGASATGTPTCVALVPSTASSMSASVLGTTTGTSWQGAIALGSTTTTSNTAHRTPVGNGILLAGATTHAITTNVYNTSTSPLYVHLVPANATTNTNENRFHVGDGGFTFDGAQTYDVVIHAEAYFDSKDN